MSSKLPVSCHRGSAARLSPCAASRTRAYGRSRSLLPPRGEGLPNGPRSVATLAAAHSTYPLMELRSASSGAGGVSSTSRGPGGAVGSHTWLAACVRHIVSMSGNMRGPMLQLVFSSSSSGGIAARTSGSGSYQHRFEAVPISQAVADNPQNWTELAAHVRRSGANGLVLVRPIASPDQHCIYASAAPSTPAPSPRPPSSSSPSSSSSSSSPTDALRQPTAACCSNPEAGAAAAHATPLTDVLGTPSGSSLDGRVGACCDDQTQESCAPRTSGASAHRDDDSSGADGSTRYYGLIVQGSAGSEADGCWVLKTTRSDGGSGGGGLGVCSCLHFSLTRVCLGQPLSAQLRDAWLVPQPAGAAAGAGGSWGRA